MTKLTEDDVRGMVDEMVDRVRAIWISIILAGSYLLFSADASWWWYPLLLVASTVCYNAHVGFSARSIIRFVAQQGGIYQDEVQTVEVVDAGREIVGRYYDNEVPEWIDVKLNGDVKRYTFKDFAPRMGESFVLPTVPDHIFYKAAVFQPAQGA